jgi:acyl carrier protein
MHKKYGNLLKLIFKRILKCKEADVKTIKLNKYYKWDSLSHLRLMIEIEKEFDMKINPSMYDQFESFDIILKYLINEK